MDQLILQWIGNRETNRHNQAQEQEAGRHNRAVEKEAMLQRYSNERIASQNQATQRQIAWINSSAQRYASDNARRASEYAANTNASTQRSVAMISHWDNIMRDITNRQANAIQERFNQGKLAVAMSELGEARRANVAREQENRLSRLQSGFFHEKELEYKNSTLQYQKQKDWYDRNREERRLEADVRLRASGQVIDLLGVGAKAKMFNQLGGRTNGQEISTKQIIQAGHATEEQAARAFWQRLNEGFDRELSR